MVEQLGANPLGLQVHNHDYTQRRRLTGYTRVELTQEFGCVAGGGEIVLPADHPLAGRLMQADRDVVPVTAHRNGWVWTGRVASYKAEGRPGAETLTVTLVDDMAQVGGVLAWAAPGMPLAMQGRKDLQTGPLRACVYHYLAENIARVGLPTYLMMPPPRVRDKSPQVSMAARMTDMNSLLEDVLAEHDYDLRARMWWPGEPFPDGKMVPLVDGSAFERRRWLRRCSADQAFNPDGPRLADPTVPGLIVEVVPVRERPHVRFSTAGRDVTQFRLSGTAPGATTAVVGGKADDWVNEMIGVGIDSAVQGILTALGAAAGPVGLAAGPIAGGLIKSAMMDSLLAFSSRSDVERAARMGPFHPRESFTSSGAGTFTFDTQSLAERALLDASGGQAIEVEIADGMSKVLGDDQRAPSGKMRHGWRVGDRCNFEEHLSGVVVSDIVTGVTVTDEAGGRMRVVPRVGKRRNTSNAYLDFTTALSRAVSTLRDLGLSGGA